MRTANPALNAKTFAGLAGTQEAMTIQGTVNKTALLLVILAACAIFTWDKVYQAEVPSSGALLILMGAIGGLIVALITVFKKAWSPVTAPIYAALEGLFLGGISAHYEMQYSGIVMNAVLLTFGTLFGLLAAYRSGLIKATENFKLGVFAATGGIALLYLATMVLHLFGVAIPFIHEAGILGIAFSLFVVIVAALNLVLDFDFIENGASQGAPRYMEWYASFGLMVTLVWLYLEILRLLSKLARRR